MTNKKMIEKLRELRIFNTFDLCSIKNPFITLSIQSGYRAVVPSGWMVTIKGRRFKDSAWYDDGSKRFSYSYRQDKIIALMEAISYCKMEFGVKMVKNCFGDYITSDDWNSAIEKIKEV